MGTVTDVERITELHILYEDAARNAEQARQRRNQAIRAALLVGVRPADIARATGLTRARITQIAGPDVHAARRLPR